MSSDPGDSAQRPDLVDRALGAFDHVLDRVHDSVVRPLIMAGRALAFGLIALVATVVLALVLVIGLTRLLNVYLFAGHEWLTYGVLGVIFVVAGMIIWRWRRPVSLKK
ncbi:MAG TPA: hypothetical protein VND83_09770 [Acidimicrobiales bacterium]|nr:hypothetical protein [Acidimicrobiales bacterium]